MTQPDIDPGNSAQFEHWNGRGAEPWVKLQDRLDGQFVGLTADVLGRLDPRPGQRVLDVGCGTGYTTIEIARRVAPGGEALGIDLSAPMLALARERAARAGAAARFEQADAQAMRLPRGGFDLVFSRFGVMFFADPVAAFANLRTALEVGGRLAFLCWRAVADNPWVTVPMEAAFAHLERPAPPPPGAPGEFAFADADYVRRILEGAGFRAVALDPLDPLMKAPSLEAAVDLTLKMGPVAAALREAPDKAPAVAAALRQAYAPFAGPAGLAMRAGVWLATARA
jgi:SAM-dependent methyltransferase